MPSAELRRRTASGDIQVVARIHALRGGGPAVVLAMPGEDPDVLAEMLAAGIPTVDGGRLHTRDGAAYVERLPEIFHGSRLWAELVDDIAEV
jgi:hypothetical protein